MKPTLLITVCLLAAVNTWAGPATYAAGTTNKTAKATSAGSTKSSKAKPAPVDNTKWKKVGTGGAGAATTTAKKTTKPPATAPVKMDLQAALAALKPGDRERCEKLLGELQEICVREANRKPADPAMTKQVQDKIMKKVNKWLRELRQKYPDAFPPIKEEFVSFGVR